MSGYRLIMLDLDGTLADSTGGIVASLNGALAEYGYPPQPDGVILPLIGLPLEVVLEQLVPLDDRPIVPQLVASYRIIYLEQAIPATQLFPEVATTLRQLVAAGKTLTIASSKIRAGSERLMSHCGVLDVFSLIMGNDVVEQRKPHPEMVLRTLSHFNCSAHEALMVGDSVYDIGMGQAAGVPTCAVTYGAGTAEELHALNPTHSIERFSDLIAIAMGNE